MAPEFNFSGTSSKCSESRPPPKGREGRAEDDFQGPEHVGEEDPEGARRDHDRPATQLQVRSCRARYSLVV